MTPGINAAKKAKINHKIHQYKHNPLTEGYGLEAAQKLGISEEKVFKTLVVALDNKALVVAVIPVSSMLSMKLIAKAAGAKKAVMAAEHDVERSTGYVLGGVSPLGQKKHLKTFVDCSAQDHATIYVSAGRRGLEIELSPSDLVNLVKGSVTPLCQ
jgi:Cys-tRNA(Pro)/Cys-tRNA(Cys) deacylase